MIPVVWFDARVLCWDQSTLDEILSGNVWPTGYEFEHHVAEMPAGIDGAVVIVPARYHTPAEVQAVIDPLSWVVLLLTSDEESLFPPAALTHPNMLVWTMTPRPGVHPETHRFLGEYLPNDTSAMLARYGDAAEARPLDWFFSGQVNHSHRRKMIRHAEGLANGELLLSEGFTQGLPRQTYLHRMASAKVVLAPSGPATPDSFRCYEALEAGCVPIVEDSCPAGVGGYWRNLLGYDPPFPVVQHWMELPEVLEATLAAWPANANRAGAWWQGYKRQLAISLGDDIAEVSGQPKALDDVTVLISTSPIASHPSTAMIAETIASVRFHFPTAEILVMCDGVRPEQEHYRERYEEYLRALLWRANHEWRHVLPLVSNPHLHQAEMTRLALEDVRTEFVLFVEHDTPLVTDEPIDWPAIFGALDAREVDVMRLHFEAVIPEPHWPLMIDRTPVTVAGCPVIRTTQWSQRPHLARSDFYRQILAEWFKPEARTMIEDVMHGRAQEFPERHRLAIYAPGDNLKRSLNLDGRGDDPKYEMTF